MKSKVSHECSWCGNTNPLVDVVSNVYLGDVKERNRDKGHAHVYSFLCCKCNKMCLFLSLATVRLVQSPVTRGASPVEEIRAFYPIYPKFITKPCPEEVPKDIATDFREAVLCLSVSKRASAALSRRCLQQVLLWMGAKKKDLKDQIDEMSSSFSSTLQDFLHKLVRDVGNYSAHPNKSKTTGLLLETTEEEAEVSIAILELLFDEVFVKPAKLVAVSQRVQSKK